MSYERICSTARAAAGTAGVSYVPHTLLQYQALIDHIAHAAYIAAVLAGVPPAHADPFDEHLAEAADDLQCSFDGFITHNRYNNVYTAGGAGAINTANIVHQGRIDRGLQSLMKDCNHQLASALCAAFSTPVMTAYHHLVNLDFVRSATSCETNFGHIPHADVYYPHIQLFGWLTDEYFKAGRLLGSSSDNHFALFNSPDLSAGLEAYKKSIDPWFVSAKSMNFPTALDQLDWLQASSRLHFIYKCSQSTDVSFPLRQLYINFFQKVCAEQTANPNPITIRRLAVMVEVFRTDCAAGKISTTFEAKAPCPPFKRALFTLLTTRPTLISSWPRPLRSYMCVRLLTTVIVAPAADVGTTMPLNSPAFGAAGKVIIPCLSALTHLQMLKPRRHAIWLLQLKKTKPLRTPATRLVKLAGSLQPPLQLLSLMTRMRDFQTSPTAKGSDVSRPPTAFRNIVDAQAAPSTSATLPLRLQGYASPFSKTR